MQNAPKNKRLLAHLEHGSADFELRNSQDPMLTSAEFARSSDEHNANGAKQPSFLQRYDTPDALADEARRRVGEAKAAEPAVGRLLLQIARDNGGKLRGTDHRIKTSYSMARKVAEKLGPQRLAALASEGVPGEERSHAEFREMVNKQTDALRYTVVFLTAEYVAGVSAALAALRAEGYTELKLKNFWRRPGEATDYAGINAAFATPEASFPFEIQFHSPESLDTKQQRCHQQYSKFREDRSMVRAQYWEEMVRMWSLVPIPDGVASLGTPAVHSVNLDEALRGVSDEERRAIAETRALEEVVKPLCEQAVAATLAAEQKVTPIIEAVAGKLGLEMHGMDYRVKSSLSIARKVVYQLRSDGKSGADADDIEAAVWCEQRQALRYTVVGTAESYVTDVLAVLDELKGPTLGFTEEFRYNYWLDS